MRLGVSSSGLTKSVICWGVKLFMALYVKTGVVVFYRFSIGSQLNSLNIYADRELKSACNIIRAARFWNLDILSRFDEKVAPHTTDP